MAEPVRARGTVSSDILSHSPLAEPVRAGGSVSSDILSHSPLAEPVRAGGSVSSDILSRSPLAEAARAGGTSLFGNPVRDAGACRDCASPSRQRAGGTPLRYLLLRNLYWQQDVAIFTKKCDELGLFTLSYYFSHKRQPEDYQFS